MTCDPGPQLDLDTVEQESVFVATEASCQPGWFLREFPVREVLEPPERYAFDVDGEIAADQTRQRAQVAVQLGARLAKSGVHPGQVNVRRLVRPDSNAPRCFVVLRR